jgi:hypothetical protein
MIHGISGCPGCAVMRAIVELNADALVSGATVESHPVVSVGRPGRRGNVLGLFDLNEEDELRGPASSRPRYYGRVFWECRPSGLAGRPLAPLISSWCLAGRFPLRAAVTAD